MDSSNKHDIPKFNSDDEIIEYYVAQKHPKTFSPAILFIILLTSILGAIIGMELIVEFGLSTNTSIIGALIAVLVGMIPMRFTRQFRNIHTQNIIETAISCATFGAGNVLLVCVSVIWVFDQPQMCTGILIGGIIAFLIDITMMYWMFDTPLMGANEAWPIGIATAETILAAAELGKKAVLLISGTVVGIAGTYFGLPMDIIGVCGLGNIVALTAFCIGLLCNGYWDRLFGYALADYYVPQGVMVGAGLVALIQAGILIVRRYKNKREQNLSAAASEHSVEETAGIEEAETILEPELEAVSEIQKEIKEEVQETKEQSYVYSRSTEDMSKAMLKGVILYTIGAIIMAAIGGIFAEMSTGMLVIWVIYAMIAALVSEILVGISAMHSGYFPAMATVIIFLVLGMFIGFPPYALAFLAGYAACTGPAFADMGYDLKTGWILRGKGKHAAFEVEGRKQQYFAEMLGGVVAIVAVVLFYKAYLEAGRIPPVASVYKSTIEAGVDPIVLKYILTWAVLGGVIQLISGLKRQIGIMFAAGLLITNPVAGIAGLIFLAIRVVIEKLFGDEGRKNLNVVSAGLIAGSALFSFFSNTFKLFKPTSK